MRPIKWIVGLPRSGKTEHIIKSASTSPILFSDHISRKLGLHLAALEFKGNAYSFAEAIPIIRSRKRMRSIWINYPDLPQSSLVGFLNSFVNVIGISQVGREVWVESNVSSSAELAASTRTLDRLSMLKGYSVRPLTTTRKPCLEIHFDADEMWRRIDDIFSLVLDKPMLEISETTHRTYYA